MHLKLINLLTNRIRLKIIKNFEIQPIALRIYITLDIQFLVLPLPCGYLPLLYGYL